MRNSGQFSRILAKPLFLIVIMLISLLSVYAAEYGSNMWEAGYEPCYNCNWICEENMYQEKPFMDWSDLGGLSAKWDSAMILGTEAPCPNCWWYGGKYWLLNARTYVYAGESYDKIFNIRSDDDILVEVFSCGESISKDCELMYFYCNNGPQSYATSLPMEKGWNLVYIGYIQDGGYSSLRYNKNHGTIFSKDPKILAMHHDTSLKFGN